MKEYNFLSTPIVDIVNEIIIDAVNMNASDIHFDSSEKFLKIRVRVDGELRDYSIVENKYKRNLITRIKLLSGMNITESRLPQDGAIKGVIEGRDLDLRVSCLPTIFGEKVVIRILDYTMSLKGVESLGFTEENYQLILKMLANPNGIILVTGATGSGKSTTTYAMLQRLNSEEANIITVEDPVEMNIEGINQVQVNSEIGLDFSNVLRSILRQDPNIILIGEIRDTETAQIAVRASITGHLVLSTLHTNNSLTSIERLLDMDVERYLLSASLKGIISQNLAKKLCPECKIKRPTTEAEKRIFKRVLNKDVNEIYDHGSCEHCRNGYKGRIALQEVLLINDEIRDAINDNLKRSSLRELIYGRGVKTLFQDGLIKVMEGITSIDEVFRLVEAEAEDGSDNIYSKYDDETNNNEENISIENENTSIDNEENKKTNNLDNEKPIIDNENENAPFMNSAFSSIDLRPKNESIIKNNFNEEEIAKFIPNDNEETNNLNIDETTKNDEYIDDFDNNDKTYEQDDEKFKNLLTQVVNRQSDISPTINYNNIVSADKLYSNDKETDLESTQDIFASLWNNNKEQKSDYITMNDVNLAEEENNINLYNSKPENNYTDDLLNLINMNIYNDKQ